MNDIVNILKEAGYTVIEGADQVKSAINFSNNENEWLCSGYGVFPGGVKCKGCSDCRKESQP